MKKKNQNKTIMLLVQAILVIALISQQTTLELDTVLACIPKLLFLLMDEINFNDKNSEKKKKNK
jgi:hypothetical protein